MTEGPARAAESSLQGGGGGVLHLAAEGRSCLTPPDKSGYTGRSSRSIKNVCILNNLLHK